MFNVNGVIYSTPTSTMSSRSSSPTSSCYEHWIAQDPVEPGMESSSSRMVEEKESVKISDVQLLAYKIPVAGQGDMVVDNQAEVNASETDALHKVMTELFLEHKKIDLRAGNVLYRLRRLSDTIYGYFWNQLYFELGYYFSEEAQKKSTIEWEAMHFLVLERTEIILNYSMQMGYLDMQNVICSELIPLLEECTFEEAEEHTSPIVFDKDFGR